MVPAQFPPKELLATIVFLSVAVLLRPLFDMPPPPSQITAPLAERVELLTVSVPALYMPPPAQREVLPERVELLTVSVPESVLYMPAPLLELVAEALLPERVELLTVSVPALYMPPPEPA